MHWLACLTNSVGLVLTLVTLSSNCLKLTTSLLDGYINGQVDVMNNEQQSSIVGGTSKESNADFTQVGVSLLLVLMGYLGLLVFLILTERLTRYPNTFDNS